MFKIVFIDIDVCFSLLEVDCPVGELRDKVWMLRGNIWDADLSVLDRSMILTEGGKDK